MLEKDLEPITPFWDQDFDSLEEYLQWHEELNERNDQEEIAQLTLKMQEYYQETIN